MRIHVLPSELANQIAAGEVVERPSSVAKELLENSIDAGATKVIIDIEQGGIQSIHIRDNGKGIAKEDLALALTRHATSKIQSLADLDNVDSLGFRGEALASIASIAQVSLTAKTQDQDDAWQVKTGDNSAILNPEVAAHPVGTSIHVRSLFYNTPARRKFLKSVKTEFNHIDECVRRIALACPTLEITLSHQGKTVRHYRRSDTTSDTKRLTPLCGEAFVAHSAFVETDHLGLKLYGWVVDASIGDKQLTPQYMYVNGRFVRDRFLSHAVRQAYEVAEADWCRSYVLFLEIDTNEVDVNVHPTKHEVRFTQPRRIHDFLVSVLLHVLQKQPEIPKTAPIADKPVPVSDEPEPQTYISSPVTTPIALAQPRHKYQTHTNRSLSSAPSCAKQAQAAWMGLMTPEETPQPAVAHQEPEKQTTQGSPLPLCMIAGRYCLCQSTSGFERIDIAKLSVLTEFLQAKLTGKPLLMPIRFALEAMDITRLETHKTFLEQWGLRYKCVSQKNLIITHAPDVLQNTDFSAALPVWLETFDEMEAIHERCAFIINNIDIKSNMLYDLPSAESLLNTNSWAVIQSVTHRCTEQALLEAFIDD